MAKLRIFPDPAALSLSVIRSRGKAAIRDASLQIARRQALNRFAAHLFEGTSVGRSYIKGEILCGRSKVLQLKRSREIKILYGVGAVIIDERYVDRPSITAHMKCKVFDNKAVKARLHIQSVGIGPPVGRLWHLGAGGINVGAYAGRKVTAPDVVVGVLDTGMELRPDLPPPIKFCAFDSDGHSIGGKCKDYGNHGTHVCGIIAGAQTGVAPGVGLAVAAVLTDMGSGSTAQILAGIDWLIDDEFGRQQPGVDILNASLGTTGSDNLLYAALARARCERGIFTVGAIGDEGETGADQTDWPANYDIVAGIGSTDAGDTVADFSNWSTTGLLKPDFCAPGVNIISTSPGQTMRAMSGTSQSAAIISGAAALILQRNSDLRYRVHELEGEMMGYVDKGKGSPANRAGKGVFRFH